MRKRKKTDLDAVLQRDHFGEWWLHAATKFLADERSPLRDEEKAYRQKMLDELFSEAMIDAMAQWWIPVPPMQQRFTEGTGPFWEPLSTLERRIRMVKPTVTDRYDLYVGWHAEPMGSMGWEPYIPEYEDEPVRETPKSPGAGNREGHHEGASPSLAAPLPPVRREQGEAGP